MANSILKPGYNEEVTGLDLQNATEECLKKTNYLAEFDSEIEKSIVRENLNVPSKDNVYDKTETLTQISEQILQAFKKYLEMDDPFGLLPQVQEMIKGMVKSNGTVPFTVPQIGVDPLQDQHLATKSYVDKLIAEHMSDEDPHNAVEAINSVLSGYSKKNDVYKKSQTYSAKEVQELVSDKIKSDGTTPFKKAQVGVDPQIDSHLATKRYIDKMVEQHLLDIDPHGFVALINKKLASYAKTTDVYDKAQTYSRAQLDQFISGLVNTYLSSAINKYKQQMEDKISEVNTAGYIKSDGSVSFTAPQAGVQATEDYQLTTLEQVKELIDISADEVSENKDLWITSGATEYTVGALEKGTELPSQMTLQQVCDAIFYGKTLDVTVPEYVSIGETCNVEIAVTGSTLNLRSIEVYQDGALVQIVDASDLVDGKTTVSTLAMYDNTSIKVKAINIEGGALTSEKTVKAAYPMFIGLMPSTMQISDLTLDTLKKMHNADKEGTQNRFINCSDDVGKVSFHYEYTGLDAKKIFVMMPESYPELLSMQDESDLYTRDLFAVTRMIPTEIVGKSISYKVYLFKIPLTEINCDVEFNFC